MAKEENNDSVVYEDPTPIFLDRVTPDNSFAFGGDAYFDKPISLTDVPKEPPTSLDDISHPVLPLPATDHLTDVGIAEPVVNPLSKIDFPEPAPDETELLPLAEEMGKPVPIEFFQLAPFETIVDHEDWPALGSQDKLKVIDKYRDEWWKNNIVGNGFNEDPDFDYEAMMDAYVMPHLLKDYGFGDKAGDVRNAVSKVYWEAAPKFVAGAYMRGKQIKINNRERWLEEKAGHQKVTDEKDPRYGEYVFTPGHKDSKEFIEYMNKKLEEEVPEEDRGDDPRFRRGRQGEKTHWKADINSAEYEQWVLNYKSNKDMLDVTKRQIEGLKSDIEFGGDFSKGIDEWTTEQGLAPSFFAGQTWKRIWKGNTSFLEKVEQSISKSNENVAAAGSDIAKDLLLTRGFVTIAKAHKAYKLSRAIVYNHRANSVINVSSGVTRATNSLLNPQGQELVGFMKNMAGKVTAAKLALTVTAETDAYVKYAEDIMNGEDPEMAWRAKNSLFFITLLGESIGFNAMFSDKAGAVTFLRLVKEYIKRGGSEAITEVGQETAEMIARHLIGIEGFDMEALVENSLNAVTGAFPAGGFSGAFHYAAKNRGFAGSLEETIQLHQEQVQADRKEFLDSIVSTDTGVTFTYPAHGPFLDSKWDIDESKVEIALNDKDYRNEAIYADLVPETNHFAVTEGHDRLEAKRRLGEKVNVILKAAADAAAVLKGLGEEDDQPGKRMRPADVMKLMMDLAHLDQDGNMLPPTVHSDNFDIETEDKTEHSQLDGSNESDGGFVEGLAYWNRGDGTVADVYLDNKRNVNGQVYYDATLVDSKGKPSISERTGKTSKTRSIPLEQLLSRAESISLPEGTDVSGLAPRLGTEQHKEHVQALLDLKASQRASNQVPISDEAKVLTEREINSPEFQERDPAGRGTTIAALHFMRKLFPNTRMVIYGTGTKLKTKPKDKVIRRGAYDPSQKGTIFIDTDYLTGKEVMRVVAHEVWHSKVGLDPDLLKRFTKYVFDSKLKRNPAIAKILNMYSEHDSTISEEILMEEAGAEVFAALMNNREFWSNMDKDDPLFVAMWKSMDGIQKEFISTLDSLRTTDNKHTEMLGSIDDLDIAMAIAGEAISATPEQRRAKNIIEEIWKNANMDFGNLKTMSDAARETELIKWLGVDFMNTTDLQLNDVVDIVIEQAEKANPANRPLNDIPFAVAERIVSEFQKGVIKETSEAESAIEDVEVYSSIDEAAEDVHSVISAEGVLTPELQDLKDMIAMTLATSGVDSFEGISERKTAVKMRQKLRTALEVAGVPKDVAHRATERFAHTKKSVEDSKKKYTDKKKAEDKKVNEADSEKGKQLREDLNDLRAKQNKQYDEKAKHKKAAARRKWQDNPEGKDKPKKDKPKKDKPKESLAEGSKDAKGNIIPPSKRFDPTKKDIRYSLEGFDEDFAAAEKSGDKEVARTILNMAAQKAAPVVHKVYHGVAKGELEGDAFDMDKMGDNTGARSARLGIFTSTDPENPETYLIPGKPAEDHGLTIAPWVENPDLKSPQKIREDGIEDQSKYNARLAKIASKTEDAQTSRIFSDAVRRITTFQNLLTMLETLDPESATDYLREISHALHSSGQSHSASLRHSIVFKQDENLWKDMSVTSIIRNLEKVIEMGATKDGFNSLTPMQVELFENMPTVEIPNFYGGVDVNPIPEERKSYVESGSWQDVNQTISVWLRPLQKRLQRLGVMVDNKDLGIQRTDPIPGGKNYELYVLGDDVAVHDDKQRTYRERQYSDWILKAWYAGKNMVVIKNTLDPLLTDLVIVKNAEQAKSAELFTYYKEGDAEVVSGEAKVGDLIPVSKRFDRKRKKIRFSLAQDSDTDLQRSEKDEEYMDAVGSDDVTTQEKVVGEFAAAADWDSVGSISGLPRTVNHGSPDTGFTKWKKQTKKSHSWSVSTLEAFHFTTREDLSEGQYTERKTEGLSPDERAERAEQREEAKGRERRGEESWRESERRGGGESRKFYLRGKYWDVAEGMGNLSKDELAYYLGYADPSKEFVVDPELSSSVRELNRITTEEHWGAEGSVTVQIVTPEMKKLLQDLGFDGIKHGDLGGTEFAVFDEKNIKSADPITRYIAEDPEVESGEAQVGDIIPPSKRFDLDRKDPKGPDTRFSLAEGEGVDTPEAQGDIQEEYSYGTFVTRVYDEPVVNEQGVMTWRVDFEVTNNMIGKTYKVTRMLNRSMVDSRYNPFTDMRTKEYNQVFVQDTKGYNLHHVKSGGFLLDDEQIFKAGRAAENSRDTKVRESLDLRYPADYEGQDVEPDGSVRNLHVIGPIMGSGDGEYKNYAHHNISEVTHPYQIDIPFYPLSGASLRNPSFFGVGGMRDGFNSKINQAVRGEGSQLGLEQADYILNLKKPIVINGYVEADPRFKEGQMQLPGTDIDLHPHQERGMNLNPLDRTLPRVLLDMLIQSGWTMDQALDIWKGWEKDHPRWTPGAKRRSPSEAGQAVRRWFADFFLEVVAPEIKRAGYDGAVFVQHGKAVSGYDKDGRKVHKRTSQIISAMALDQSSFRTITQADIESRGYHERSEADQELDKEYFEALKNNDTEKMMDMVLDRADEELPGHTINHIDDSMYGNDDIIDPHYGHLLGIQSGKWLGWPIHKSQAERDRGRIPVAVNLGERLDLTDRLLPAGKGQLGVLSPHALAKIALDASLERAIGKIVEHAETLNITPLFGNAETITKEILKDIVRVDPDHLPDPDETRMYDGVEFNFGQIFRHYTSNRAVMNETFGNEPVPVRAVISKTRPDVGPVTAQQRAALFTFLDRLGYNSIAFKNNQGAEANITWDPSRIKSLDPVLMKQKKPIDVSEKPISTDTVVPLSERFTGSKNVRESIWYEEAREKATEHIRDSISGSENQQRIVEKILASIKDFGGDGQEWGRSMYDAENFAATNQGAMANPGLDEVERQYINAIREFSLEEDVNEAFINEGGSHALATADALAKRYVSDYPNESIQYAATTTMMVTEDNRAVVYYYAKKVFYTAQKGMEMAMDLYAEMEGLDDVFDKVAKEKLMEEGNKLFATVSAIQIRYDSLASATSYSMLARKDPVMSGRDKRRAAILDLLHMPSGDIRDSLLSDPNATKNVSSIIHTAGDRLSSEFRHVLHILKKQGMPVDDFDALSELCEDDYQFAQLAMMTQQARGSMDDAIFQFYIAQILSAFKTGLVNLTGGPKLAAEVLVEQPINTLIWQTLHSASGGRISARDSYTYKEIGMMWSDMFHSAKIALNIASKSFMAGTSIVDQFWDQESEKDLVGGNLKSSLPGNYRMLSMMWNYKLTRLVNGIGEMFGRSTLMKMMGVSGSGMRDFRAHESRLTKWVQEGFPGLFVTAKGTDVFAVKDIDRKKGETVFDPRTSKLAPMLSVTRTLLAAARISGRPAQYIRTGVNTLAKFMHNIGLVVRDQGLVLLPQMSLRSMVFIDDFTRTVAFLAFENANASQEATSQLEALKKAYASNNPGVPFTGPTHTEVKQRIKEDPLSESNNNTRKKANAMVFRDLPEKGTVQRTAIDWVNKFRTSKNKLLKNFVRVEIPFLMTPFVLIHESITRRSMWGSVASGFAKKRFNLKKSEANAVKQQKMAKEILLSKKRPPNQSELDAMERKFPTEIKLKSMDLTVILYNVIGWAFFQSLVGDEEEDDKLIQITGTGGGWLAQYRSKSERQFKKQHDVVGNHMIKINWSKMGLPSDGNWHSYSRFDPFATAWAFHADWRDALKESAHSGDDSAIARFTSKSGQMVMEKSYLQSFAEAQKLGEGLFKGKPTMKQRGRSASGYFQDLGSGFHNNYFRHIVSYANQHEYTVQNSSLDPRPMWAGGSDASKYHMRIWDADRQVGGLVIDFWGQPILRQPDMSQFGSLVYNMHLPGMMKKDMVAREGNQVFISWNRDQPMDKRYPTAIDPNPIGMSEVHPKTLELYGRIKGKYVTEAMTKLLKKNPEMIWYPTEEFMDSIVDNVTRPAATKTKRDMIKMGLIRSEVKKYAKGKKTFYDVTDGMNDPLSIAELRKYPEYN